MADNKKKALKYLSYGWCGKILKVDLSSEVITEIDTHPYADPNNQPKKKRQKRVKSKILMVAALKKSRG